MHGMKRRCVLELIDLLPIEKWTALEKELHETSGMQVSVFNTEGIRITDNKGWVNRLCPVIKAHDKGQAFICAVAHMNIAAEATQKKAPVIEECDAGLIKLVVPIFFREAFLGSIGACGLLPEDGEVDTFMVNRTIGIEEEEIDALSNDMGKVSTPFIEKLAMDIQARIMQVVERFDTTTA